MAGLPHVRRNREVWDGMSEWYQAKHGPQLNTRPLAWGMWAIPEAEIGALGDVSGKVVLELGCGGGQWSMFLAEAGARPVGLDLSEQQLSAARRLMRTPYPLVHADGEQLPFSDASFDVVLSDHGAMIWADPYATVPEVARVLRPGGRLAFNAGTPWVCACDPGNDASLSERLINPLLRPSSCRRRRWRRHLHPRLRRLDPPASVVRAGHREPHRASSAG